MRFCQSSTSFLEAVPCPGALETIHPTLDSTFHVGAEVSLRHGCVGSRWNVSQPENCLLVLLPDHYLVFTSLSSFSHCDNILEVHRDRDLARVGNVSDHDGEKQVASKGEVQLKTPELGLPPAVNVASDLTAMAVYEQDLEYVPDRSKES